VKNILLSVLSFIMIVVLSTAPLMIYNYSSICKKAEIVDGTTQIPLSEEENHSSSKTNNLEEEHSIYKTNSFQFFQITSYLSASLLVEYKTSHFSDEIPTPPPELVL